MSKKVHGLNYINQNVYLLYPFYYRLIKSVILAVEYRIKMQPIAKLIQKQQTLHRLSVLQVNKEVFIWQCLLVAVTSSGILKAKQKLGRTFNSDKLGGIDFTKISKLTMCSA